jgi:hypothetical protein
MGRTELRKDTNIKLLVNNLPVIAKQKILCQSTKQTKKEMEKVLNYGTKR